MEDERGLLKKITFEYENETRYLTDKQAQQWIENVNNMCIIMQEKGMNPFERFEFNWQKQ